MKHVEYAEDIDDLGLVESLNHLSIQCLHQQVDEIWEEIVEHLQVKTVKGTAKNGCLHDIV